MNRTVYLFIFAVTTLLLVGCKEKGQQTVVRERGQVISISDSTLLNGGTDTINLGNMRMGEVVRKELSIDNVSSQSIILGSYEASCGCTVLGYDSKPILSKGSKRIAITFDSQGFMGWQFKVLELNIAGAKAKYKIYIEGKVK